MSEDKVKSKEQFFGASNVKQENIQESIVNITKTEHPPSSFSHNLRSKDKGNIKKSSSENSQKKKRIQKSDSK